MLADDLNLAGATAKRTLATIVFTDTVGFSERMSRDESGTLDLLGQDFDRIRKACARHGGEVIKSTGDGLLMYFSSAVGAVSCAVEIQTEHARRRTNEKDSLEHRIGIHLGDVFVRESDVMGDGVNIAARLQYEAEPGGICISQTVYDVVKNTLALKTTSLGPRELKNLSQKLTLYQVLLGADQSGDQACIQPKQFEQRRFHRFNLYAIIALFAVLLGGALVFFWKKTVSPRAEMSPAIESFKSIAVLPFVNMSDDQANGYFARGIHEDILTQLAKVLDLKIISRTSVMQYSEHTGSLRSIGEALGAAAILEGSVRREGNRVRVTAQLINAKNDQHLWAETYDRDLTDVFAIQSAVAQEIVTALRAHLSPQEKERIERKPTENSQAYDFYLQARDYYSRPGNLAENFSNAERLCEEAVGLDPAFALAYAQLSRIHSVMYWFAHDRSPERLARAESAANRALSLQPELPEAHVAMGYFRYWGHRDYAGAIDEFSLAQRALPNDAEVSGALAFIQRRQGNWSEAIRNLKKTSEIDPRNADNSYELGLTYVYTRDYKSAREAFDRTLSLAPDYYAAKYHRAMLRVREAGDTTELLKVLEAVPPDLDPNFWDARRFQAFMLARQFDKARKLLSDHGPEVFTWQDFVRPKSLLEGLAATASGDDGAAKTSFEKARGILQEAIAKNDSDPRLQSALGLAEANLGNSAAAIAAGERATSLLPMNSDAVDGPTYAVDLAKIYARTGRTGDALQLLERLLRTAGPLTANELALDPAWDRIRSDAGFRQLLEKHRADHAR